MFVTKDFEFKLNLLCPVSWETEGRDGDRGKKLVVFKEKRNYAKETN